jgi:hypothetical protein
MLISSILQTPLKFEFSWKFPHAIKGEGLLKFRFSVAKDFDPTLAKSFSFVLFSAAHN